MFIFWNVCSYKRDQYDDREVKIIPSLATDKTNVWTKMPTEQTHCQFFWN